MSLIEDIQSCLSDDIKKMNDLIINHLSTKEELVTLVGKYLVDAGGKRIRPLLTMLSSKMFGYEGQNHILLATAVEFIHAATLLHDDVVDESTMRRFKPTANVIWGSKASILVGDFLFSQSFRLMVETGSTPAMRSLSRASSVIAEGEVSQLAKLKERRLISQAEYNEVITSKTAELFAASCEVGGIISNQSIDNCKIMWNFGIVLGKIFQIIDDLLDYFGSESLIGKNVADDFFEGKVTLPIILLYELLNKDYQTKLIEMIKAETRTQDNFLLVKELMEKHKIKQQIMDYLNSLKLEASSWLQLVNIENKYKDYLSRLVEFTINRTA